MGIPPSDCFSGDGDHNVCLTSSATPMISASRFNPHPRKESDFLFPDHLSGGGVVATQNFALGPKLYIGNDLNIAIFGI